MSRGQIPVLDGAIVLLPHDLSHRVHRQWPAPTSSPASLLVLPQRQRCLPPIRWNARQHHVLYAAPAKRRSARAPRGPQAQLLSPGHAEDVLSLAAYELQQASARTHCKEQSMANFQHIVVQPVAPRTPCYWCMLRQHPTPATQLVTRRSTLTGRAYSDPACERHARPWRRAAGQEALDG